MVTLIAFLINILSPAHAQLSNVKESKVVEFLKKKEACKLSFASVDSGEAVNPVYCIWTGVANPGTINEAEGCFVGRFDVLTDRYQPLFDHGSGLQARSQPKGDCSKEIITKMISVYPVSEYLSHSKNNAPLLADMRKQSNKKTKILYDPMNIVTTDLLKRMDDWKDTTNKAVKKYDCKKDSDFYDMEREVFCSDASSILHYCRTLNVSGEEKTLRERVYKQKTGKDMPGGCIMK